MFIVLLKFANPTQAAQFMPAHNAWIAQGLADGAFLLIGTLQPKLGGAILVRGENREAVEARVAADPFVEHGVVSAEILEILPNRVAAGLEHLLS